MNQPAVVTIPTPCSEPWERMTTVSGGRHCAACQKTVHDFSTFSDRELANWLATYNGGAVCGRLRTDQLERSIQPVQIRSQPNHGSWVRWAVALVLGWQTTKGQTVPTQTASSPTSLSPLVTRNVFTLTEPVLFYVRGRVVDEAGIPYKSATVLNERNGKFTLTDEGGNFQLSIHRADQVSDSLRVSIMGGDGGRIRTTILTTKEQPPLLLTMYPAEPSRVIVGGGLLITRQEPPKRRSFWQFLTGRR
ncbi:hypothetical protein [Fibrivirga algicola]|uniref:Carboxypeptidase regulatory-like domain-containing protein n=1 Tax=Fibrivirga algicola TaxID=2950420 RepID=A0ABX0QG62_9BACT|nr:hypothetical protein [Fibrivirga algicola]NID11410.1 hypothetical protein [Fibrivirga algicola]